MAVFIKLSLLVLAMVALSHAQRVLDAPRDVPQNLPWIPEWVECEFDFETFQNGPACNGCYSTLHCTPKGGVLRNCFGWTPYCVDGKCVKEPSVDCIESDTVTDVYLSDV